MMSALTSRWGSRSCLRRRETANLRELHTYELKSSSMAALLLALDHYQGSIDQAKRIFNKGDDCDKKVDDSSILVDRVTK